MDQPVLKAIDRNLPEIVNVSLEQWNAVFDWLERIDPTHVLRDTFGLTGVFPDPDSEDDPAPLLRANFDSSTSHCVGGMRLDQECDVDSVIAVMMDNIPILPEANLDYYPLADVRQTLNSSYHIPGVRVNVGLQEREVPIHKMANARFGEVGGKLVRMFMPGLLHDEQIARQQNTNYIPRGRMEALYDRAIVRAARDVLPPNVLRNFPPSYQVEEFRAAQGGGADDDNDRPQTYQQSGRSVPGVFVERWIERIRYYVDSDLELDWAVGLFFVLEGKGLKKIAGSSHPPPAEPINDVDTIPPNHPRKIAVDRVLDGFDQARLKQGPLYLDIATTIWGFKPDEDNPDLEFPVSVLPNVHFHAQIINYFTGKPINECERIVRSSGSGYSKDECAHLGDAGGLRYDVKAPGPGGAEYVQLYDTGKGIVYNLVLMQKAKRTSPHKCTTNWEKEHTGHFIPLQNAFAKAPATQSVAARVESRVPYESYGRVHAVIPAGLLSQWLLYFEDHVYWGFKTRRGVCITGVTNRFMTCPERRSITSQQVREHGSLVINLVWMANALVNRPDDGGHWDEVRDSASVHEEVDGQVVPVRPLTMFYLHSLRLSANKPPRVSINRTISTKTIAYLFSSGRMLSPGGLLSKLRGQLDRPSAISGAPRIQLINEDVWGENDPDADAAPDVPVKGAPSRGNRQRVVSYGEVDNVPNMFENVFPDQPVERYPSEEHDPEERDLGPRIDQRLSNLIYKYPSQIFGKAPNRKGTGESWTVAGPDEVTYNTFCDARAPYRLFTSWVHCGHRDDPWRKTVATYFPTVRGHQSLLEKAENSNGQGLHCLEVFNEDWIQLINELDEATRKMVIEQARARVTREWKWLPWFYSNHLWRTGAVGARTSGKRPMGAKLGGPWIIFNPKFRRE